MIIISGRLIVATADRDRMVEAMQGLVGRARAFEGCIDLAITADPLDPRRVQNLEVWRDADALAAWRAQADPPDLDVDVLADHVERYDAGAGGPVFP